ncbi:DUF1566 domain-containing protein [Flavivirga aquimarina]|uniref:DUF1566 domain-containing protein n=1 Tax=Flavivirga aquimarina TaxID=2027862 RepID=A0ABT8WDW0_9FLAO|nr:DUF1566 domain-containing protein [Flavivirga aquimarina]MDO5971228.1 DUF1566 domain-containing protein [Flavivirga aquimarina]
MKKVIYRIVIFVILPIANITISCKSNQNTSISKEKPIINNYIQIATGQTNLYNNDGKVIVSLTKTDSLYGQDANYQKGEKMAYKDNEDGTVSDLNTGLMWQKIPVPDGFTWQEAVDYCENLKLAGYDDWRIPSAKELFSISDFSSGWPYLDTTYFALASGKIVKDEQYWSSNKYVGSTGRGGDNSAFGVNHVTGHIKAYPASSPNGKGKPERNETSPPSKAENQPPPRQGGPSNGQSGPPRGNPAAKQVRAVRGANYGINNFVDNGDNTITDNASGLMWAKNDNGKGLDWQDALVYAKQSKLADYSDWRLPNVKELQGIIDYSYSPSATKASKVGPAINPLFSCTPIINEAGNNDYGYYWTNTSANFTRGQPHFYAWYVAFGMAVNREGKDFHGAGGVRFDTKYKGGALGEGGERSYNYVRLVRNVN